MKKLLVVLSLASAVSLPSWASISARLNGRQVNQPKAADKAAKVILACACDDLFPVLQEVLMQSKPEIKGILKLKLSAMGLNKDQLNSVKLMVKDAAPLVLESAQVCGDLLKKHGKGAVTIYKKTAAQMLIAGAQDAINPVEQEALEAAILELLINDAQFNQCMDKVGAFNEKWADAFAGFMQASASQEANVAQVQEALQTMLEIALSNKRAMSMQASLIPIASAIKTQEDVIQLVQACLNELETKLPQVVVSAQTFASFAVPFLATVITESVDETLLSMPA